MKLLTVGDSFTYGEELEDKNLAWPQLLADRLGYEVTNLGRPGAGNNKILRNTLENADEHDLVIVSWSHFARIEFADEHGIYDIWPGNAGNLFQGNLAHRKDIINYINRYHDDLYLYSQYLINIILLQNYLRQCNKKYIMLDSFNKCFSTLSNEKLRILAKDLVGRVDSAYYLGWPNETMMEWTFGTQMGSNGHFLEQGHEVVANKIYEYIRHLGWIS